MGSVIEVNEVDQNKQKERGFASPVKDVFGRGQSASFIAAKIENVSDIKTRTVNPLMNDSSFEASGSSFNGSRSDIGDVDHGIQEPSHNLAQDLMMEKTYNLKPDNFKAKMPS